MNDFMFNGGPSRRFVGQASPGQITAVQVIPGGESGVPGTPFFGNQLGIWLTKKYHKVFTTSAKINRNSVSKEVFEPQ
jgi:penicillin amidase